MTSGILEVRLVDAAGIREKYNICCLNCFMPWFGATNSYVLIQYENQERISSVSHREGKKQVWNENFKFNVEYPVGEDHLHKLTFRIVNKHKFNADNFVGEATIYAKDVVLQGMDKGKVELGHRKYRVVRPDKTYSGEISVAVTFTKVNLVHGMQP